MLCRRMTVRRHLRFSVRDDGLPIEGPRLDLPVREDTMDASVERPEHELRGKTANPIADRELVRSRNDALPPSETADANRRLARKVQPRRLVECVRPLELTRLSWRQIAALSADLRLKQLRNGDVGPCSSPTCTSSIHRRPMGLRSPSKRAASDGSTKNWTSAESLAALTLRAMSMRLTRLPQSSSPSGGRSTASLSPLASAHFCALGLNPTVVTTKASSGWRSSTTAEKSRTTGRSTFVS
jgi:hypothetical protein